MLKNIQDLTRVLGVFTCVYEKRNPIYYIRDMAGFYYYSSEKTRYNQMLC